MATAKAKAPKAIYAVGRRKTASARVHLTPLDKKKEEKKDDTEAKEESRGDNIVVNGKPFANYFSREIAQNLILAPLELTDRLAKYAFKVTVSGGGISGQAGAVRHGISRVLEKIEPELRGDLKKAGLLTRDPRAVERKKPGRHKARKGTQFSKR